MTHPPATMTRAHASRPLLLATLLGLGLSAAPNLAQAIEARPGPLRLTPAQQQKLFPELRRLSLQTTQARIAILQKHQRCLAAAGSLEALQGCQRQQRQALIEQQRLQREETGQLLQRLGITAPNAGRNGDQRRQPPQPDGVPLI